MRYKININRFGKKHTRQINVDRVPYGVYQIAQRLDGFNTELTLMVEEEAAIMEDIKQLRSEKPEGYRKKIKDLLYDLKSMREEGYQAADDQFFKSRVEAIILLLEANGIEEDDELLDFETWRRAVDFKEMVALLEMAKSMDISKKKENG